MTTPYDPSAYPPVAVTVDLVVLTVRGDRLEVLLVRRGSEPFAGLAALPGGFIREGEDLVAAARRELAEETGLRGLGGHLEQLATYGDPGRDPRMRVVSVAYLALAPELPAPSAGGDAAESSWQPVADLLPARDVTAGRGRRSRPRLAFDHDRILADGVERARAKLEYSGLAAAFCGPEFTVAELRRVYEIVWGVPLDPRNFHRKVTSTEGLLTPTGRAAQGGTGRPAQLYRAGAADPATAALHPPLLRPGPSVHRAR